MVLHTSAWPNASAARAKRSKAIVMLAIRYLATCCHSRVILFGEKASIFLKKARPHLATVGPPFLFVVLFILAEGQNALWRQEHEQSPVAQQEPQNFGEIEREERQQTQAVLEPPVPNRAASTIREFPEIAVTHDFAKENAPAASIGRTEQEPAF